MDLIQAAAALEHTPLGAWARGSAYGYPLANLIHLLGLVMLIGAIGVLDLRLLGAFRRLPVTALAHAMIPLAAAGLVLLIPSGLVMFAADAGPLLRQPFFLAKVGLIALALGNVAAFHLTWRGSVEASVPAHLKVMAATSLILWLTAAGLGRLIAYA